MLGIITNRENIKGEFAADILHKVTGMNSGIETDDERAIRGFINSEENGIEIEWN